MGVKALACWKTDGGMDKGGGNGKRMMRPREQVHCSLSGVKYLQSLESFNLTGSSWFGLVRERN